MSPEKDIRAARERLVREHMESENVHEYNVTIGTFHHPRYELIGTGDVFDGEEEVRAYFAESRTAFPDQRNEPIAFHHADEALIAEFWLRGTHLGSFRGLPPTGRSFECRMAAFFVFGGPDNTELDCERVYFDAATILRQLGVAHDPNTLTGRIATVFNHPLTIGGALLRRLRR